MLVEQAEQNFLKYLETIGRSPETLRSYRTDLRYLKEFLEQKYNGPVYVGDVKRADMEQYLLYLKDVKKIQDRSRSHALGTMRTFFKYLQGAELVTSNPTALITNIKFQQKERQYLTEAEVEQLREAVRHPMVKVMIPFLYLTGLRISEAVNLTLDAVDLSENVIHVREGKGRKDRTVPMNAKLHAVLVDYLEWRQPKAPSDRFFVTQRTTSVLPQFVNRHLRDAVKRLGWKKRVSAHILRHSYATALIERDVNIIHVSKLLGHSNVKVTSIYTHSKMEDLRKAVETL